MHGTLVPLNSVFSQFPFLFLFFFSNILASLYMTVVSAKRMTRRASTESVTTIDMRNIIHEHTRVKERLRAKLKRADCAEGKVESIAVSLHSLGAVTGERETVARRIRVLT